jgi:hypothetical protein
MTTATSFKAPSTAIMAINNILEADLPDLISRSESILGSARDQNWQRAVQFFNEVNENLRTMLLLTNLTLEMINVPIPQEGLQFLKNFQIKGTRIFDPSVVREIENYTINGTTNKAKLALANATFEIADRLKKYLNEAYQAIGQDTVTPIPRLAVGVSQPPPSPLEIPATPAPPSPPRIYRAAATVPQPPIRQPTAPPTSIPSLEKLRQERLSRLSATKAAHPPTPSVPVGTTVPSPATRPSLEELRQERLSRLSTTKAVQPPIPVTPASVAAPSPLPSRPSLEELRQERLSRLSAAKTTQPPAAPRPSLEELRRERLSKLATKRKAPSVPPVATPTLPTEQQRRMQILSSTLREEPIPQISQVPEPGPPSLAEPSMEAQVLGTVAAVSERERPTLPRKRIRKSVLPSFEEEYPSIQATFQGETISPEKPKRPRVEETGFVRTWQRVQPAKVPTEISKEPSPTVPVAKMEKEEIIEREPGETYGAYIHPPQLIQEELVPGQIKFYITREERKLDELQYRYSSTEQMPPDTRKAFEDIKNRIENLRKMLSKAQETGQYPAWFWFDVVSSSGQVLDYRHGPFVDKEEAGRDAQRFQRSETGPSGKAILSLYAGIARSWVEGEYKRGCCDGSSDILIDSVQVDTSSLIDQPSVKAFVVVGYPWTKGTIDEEFQDQYRFFARKYQLPIEEEKTKLEFIYRTSPLLILSWNRKVGRILQNPIGYEVPNYQDIVYCGEPDAECYGVAVAMYEVPPDMADDIVGRLEESLATPAEGSLEERIGQAKEQVEAFSKSLYPEGVDVVLRSTPGQKRIISVVVEAYGENLEAMYNLAYDVYGILIENDLAVDQGQSVIYLDDERYSIPQAISGTRFSVSF